MCNIVLVPPRIENGAQVQLKATLGSTVELPCKTSGIPAPQLTWQKGTRVLADVPGIQLLYNNNNIAEEK